METRKNKDHALVSFIVGVLAALALILFYLSITVWEFGNFPDSLRLCLFLGSPILSIIALVFGIISLRKKEKKSLSSIGIILGGLVILIIIGFLILIRKPPPPHIRPRVMSQMAQMRSLAEIIYSQDSSYERVSCSEASVMGDLCEDIGVQTGVEPTVHSTKDEYCIYVPFPNGGYCCIDSSWDIVEVEINPSDSGYCDGITFNCPP